MTLRVGTQLVGLRADTDASVARLRALLAFWIDDDHPDVPWVFDVRLEPSRQLDGDAVGHRPRPVPQLRLGQVLMARSRHADDVLRALASMLGGVLARQDDTRVWSGMRTFAGHGNIILVDAQPPALSADPFLVRAGIVELPTWSVAIDGSNVHVPPALDRLDWDAARLNPPDASVTTWQTAALAGIVAFDPRPHHHEPDNDHEIAVELSGAAALLSRFAVRHPSLAWFSTVERLIRDGRVLATSDRSGARQQLVELARR